MDKRKVKRAGILLALLIGVPATAFVAYALTFARSPLEGVSHHDFGFVPVKDGKSTYEHTYELVNRTGRTITILDIRPSCGCAVAEASSYLIDPGETLTIRAKLTLSRSGLKEEAIGLVLKDRGVRLVTMSAVGWRDPPVAIQEAEIPLDAGGNGRITFSAEFWTDGPQPEPSVTVPDGFVARLAVWELDHSPDPGKKRPSVWHGYVEISWDGGELPEDAMLTISTADGSATSVPIVGGV